MRGRPSLGLLAATLMLTACAAPGPSPVTTSAPTTSGAVPTTAPAPTASAADGGTATVQPPPEPMPLGPDGRPFTVTDVARFTEPWALEFLPDGSLLVSERSGQLHLRDAAGTTRRVSGVPDVVVDGQGGLGDIILGPTFDSDQTVYLSWVERGQGGTGAAVGRARLVTGASPRLESLTVIWRQVPKTSGRGHFSHRLLFSPDGQYLFVSSGDRQKMEPAQDLSNTLGTIVRLTPDGRPAPGNPFADRGSPADEIWSYGHRNPLGLDFDADGRLWSSEMGPQGGDELNLIEPGGNYGWPRASNGSHYSGDDIPDHRPGDGFVGPSAWWTPSVSPGSLLVYDGDAFPGWTGDALVGALSGQALIRVDLNGSTATLGEQWDMGMRIREVEQGPDGSVWLLQDVGGGRLMKLTPVDS